MEQQRWLPLARFLLVLGVLNFAYFFLYAPRAWFLPTHVLHGHVMHVLLTLVSHGAVVVLGWLGHWAELTPDMRDITLFESPILINIRNYCLGLDVLVVFTSLVISYPGSWKKRLWFLPLGLMGINIINIFRVTAMCLWAIYEPPIWVDNHDLFNYLAAGFVLLMFVFWVKLNSRK